jgi:hypothetical protein
MPFVRYSSAFVFLPSPAACAARFVCCRAETNGGFEIPTDLRQNSLTVVSVPQSSRDAFWPDRRQDKYTIKYNVLFRACDANQRDGKNPLPSACSSHVQLSRAQPTTHLLGHSKNCSPNRDREGKCTMFGYYNTVRFRPFRPNPGLASWPSFRPGNVATARRASHPGLKHPGLL